MSEEEFWKLTPVEFNLLLKRHRGDVYWQEAMAAVGPWITAEVNRDRKRHRKPFELMDWTITGLCRKRKRKKRPEPGALFAHISGSLRALGGKDDGNSRR